MRMPRPVGSVYSSSNEGTGMGGSDPSIVFNTEDWRTFFSGRFHQTLSVTISEAYSKLFKFCVEHELIIDPQDAINSVKVLDVNDLSDTTSLPYFRFATRLGGAEKRLNISQLLNAHFREQKKVNSVVDLEQLKTMLRLCRELENICSTLKLARNLNAHVQKPILDTGFTLQVSSAILRLYEIFDYAQVSVSCIQEIQSRVFFLIENGFVGSPSTDRSSATLNTLSKNFPSKAHDADNLAELERIKQNTVEPHRVDVDDEVALDIEIQSSELRRQKLNKIRIEIYRFLEGELNQTDKKLNILYGSNLSDVLAYEPKSQDDLRKVLSVKLLLSRQPSLTGQQLEKFGQQILDVLK